MFSKFEKGFEYVPAGLGRPGPSGNPEAIAAAGDLDTETPFDLFQVLIELTAKVGEAVIVSGFENDIPRGQQRVQDRERLRCNPGPRNTTTQ